MLRTPCALLWLLSCVGPLLARPLPVQEPELDPRLAAELNGEPITWEDYRDFLVAISGKRPLQELILHKLLAAEAARLGISVTEAELEAAWRELLDTWLAERFDGDAARLDEELARMGHDRETYERLFKLQKRRELLQTRIVLATRRVSEEDILRRFEREHGVDGVRTRVRQVLLLRPRTQLQMEREGVPREQLDAATVQARMLEDARGLLAELAAGASLEELARAHTHDLAARAAGGLLEGETWRRYGPLLSAAVAEAPVGEPQGPVVTGAGVHVFVVEARERTTLDEVRAELRAALEREPPSFEELTALEQRLRDAARIRTF